VTSYLLGLIPKDRASGPGRLLVCGGVNFAEFDEPCQFKSDNAKAAEMGNPDRDPRYPYGDHPTGLWRIQVGRQYGVWPLISCVALRCDWMYGGGQSWVGQNAMDAYGAPGYKPWRPLPPATKASNRDGARWSICIHGGTLGVGGKLRPTYGCARLTDEAQGRLVTLVQSLGITRYLGVEVPE